MSENENKIKRKGKDSVFTDLFGKMKYLVQLYSALHPERTITEDMIQNVTLKNILVNHQYNDLGFMVDDKYILLVEAQSTWSINIVLRVVMYMMQTYQEYIMDTEQNLYSSRPVNLPKPEMYVIYTGEGKADIGEISLARDFFGDENCPLDAKVKVITETDSDDI